MVERSASAASAPPASEPSSTDIEHAAQLLREGRLVAFPTETVYGLGADASNPAAVESIFSTKGRPSNHPVIVHLAPNADPNAWTAPLPAATRRLMETLTERFWPGPLTLILPCAPGVPKVVTGGQDSVGLRCPAHPVAQALLKAFAEARSDEVDTRSSGRTMCGIAAPSANRFGRISPTTADHVRREFPSGVYILDGGDCPLGIESTILDLSRAETLGPVLLRPGSVTIAMIADAIGALPHAAGTVPGAATDAAAPRASGTLAAHYAPRTRLRLVDREALVSAMRHRLRDVAVWSYSVSAPSGYLCWFAAPVDATSYARALYATLRRLDDCGAGEIWIEAPPHDSEWAAVNDRLKRAAVGST